MDEESSFFIKKAKVCHTKQAWKDFFKPLEQKSFSFFNPKQLNELFKILQSDPQCLQYDQEIWSTMLNFCLKSWNLELGIKIADFLISIPSPQISILSSSIHMENGSPSTARKLASRALRLANIADWEKLQLQMIICNSYVEEGKSSPAVRLLSKMEQAISTANIAPVNLADLLIIMARAQFFLGRYQDAAKIFSQANQIYINLQLWEAAAKSLFNTAACYHNSGNSQQQLAFTYIEKCMTLCKERGLFGPLSHCYAFYGTVHYQNGKFLIASQQYKLALDYAPTSDKSFRRLHITSMLSFTYLKLGNYQQAEKIGSETLDLAKLDDSERFRSRYEHLASLLNWQRGNFELSHQLIRDAVKPLLQQGINTLEELSLASYFFHQCAMLLEKDISTKLKISEQLKNDTASWFEYTLSLSQLLLAKGKFSEALKIAKECHKASSNYGSKYISSSSILTIVQIFLSQSNISEELFDYISQFDRSLELIDDSPLRVHQELIKASIDYQKGNFYGTVKHISAASKYKKIDSADQQIIQGWLTAIQGKSPKINSQAQIKLMTHHSKIYFSPKLEAMGQHTFKISGLYNVKLDRHTILSNILEFLISKEGHCASPAELQEHVWGQSLQTQGWQQKIRNTLMRLREYFPQTIAPILLHSDNKICLFKEAISIEKLKLESPCIEDMFIEILESTPLSSHELSQKAQYSSATTKRILRRLLQQNAISAEKKGRNILYSVKKT